MFSMMVFLAFHWDSMGLAAARMEVRAFSWQMIPALAMDRVCCSITSCSTDLNFKGRVLKKMKFWGDLVSPNLSNFYGP